MRGIITFAGGVVVGVGLGFVAAHLINSTERGRAFFADVNARLDGFTGAVRDGYDARTRELVHAIDQGGRGA